MELFGFLPIGWLDVIDILLVAYLMYQLYRLVQGTAAIRIFVGILALYLFWKLVEVAQMELLSEILKQFISVGVIALIIVFQQEIRRFLLLLGTPGLLGDSPVAKRFGGLFRKKDHEIELDIKSVSRACGSMAESRTGALIVIYRSAAFDTYSATGLSLNAKVSSDLIESIFFKNNPLHDGAIILVRNTINAARCILPVSENPEIPGHLGMRHRAAIGVTENSDCLAIVVSEQTGQISVVHHSTLTAMADAAALEKHLEKALS
ncbi:MAG: diadenylate cyclase CdaA [Bacteroidota bacterium]